MLIHRIATAVTTALLAGCTFFQPTPEFGQPTSTREIIAICSLGYGTVMSNALLASIEVSGGKFSIDSKDEFVGAVIRQSPNMATADGVKLFEKAQECMQPRMAKRDEEIRDHQFRRGQDLSRSHTELVRIADKDIRLQPATPKRLPDGTLQEAHNANFIIRIVNFGEIRIECRVEVFVQLYETEEDRRLQTSRRKEYTGGGTVLMAARQSGSVQGSIDVPTPGNQIKAEHRDARITGCWPQ